LFLRQGEDNFLVPEIEEETETDYVKNERNAHQ